MAKRRIIVNSRNEEVEEGDPDSARIMSEEDAKARGVKMLSRKKAEEKAEPAAEEKPAEEKSAPAAKQVDGPAENKARSAPADTKGR